MPDGVVALGDSITYGEGGMALGVDARSWALWLALALDEPYSNYAVPGAVVGDVLAEQLPRVRRSHRLGLLYVGVNDVRGLSFDAAGFDAALGRVVDGLVESCARVALVTVPADLGRPPAGPVKTGEANAAIRAHAARVGAFLVELDDFAGWRWVLPDAVHPTALGQLEIADRAARAVGAPVRPSTLTPPKRAIRDRLGFARAWLWMWAKDVWRREREAARLRRSAG